MEIKFGELGQWITRQNPNLNIEDSRRAQLIIINNLKERLRQQGYEGNVPNDSVLRINEKKGTVTLFGQGIPRVDTNFANLEDQEYHIRKDEYIDEEGRPRGTQELGFQAMVSDSGGQHVEGGPPNQEYDQMAILDQQPPIPDVPPQEPYEVQRAQVPEMDAPATAQATAPMGQPPQPPPPQHLATLSKQPPIDQSVPQRPPREKLPTLQLSEDMQGLQRELIAEARSIVGDDPERQQKFMEFMIKNGLLKNPTYLKSLKMKWGNDTDDQSQLERLRALDDGTFAGQFKAMVGASLIDPNKLMDDHRAVQIARMQNRKGIELGWDDIRKDAIKATDQRRKNLQEARGVFKDMSEFEKAQSESEVEAQKYGDERDDKEFSQNLATKKDARELRQLENQQREKRMRALNEATKYTGDQAWKAYTEESRIYEKGADRALQIELEKFRQGSQDRRARFRAKAEAERDLVEAQQSQAQHEDRMGLQRGQLGVQERHAGVAEGRLDFEMGDRFQRQQERDRVLDRRHDRIDTERERSNRAREDIARMRANSLAMYRAMRGRAGGQTFNSPEEYEAFVKGQMTPDQLKDYNSMSESQKKNFRTGGYAYSKLDPRALSELNRQEDDQRRIVKETVFDANGLREVNDLFASSWNLLNSPNLRYQELQGLSVNFARMMGERGNIAVSERRMLTPSSIWGDAKQLFARAFTASGSSVVPRGQVRVLQRAFRSVYEGRINAAGKAVNQYIKTAPTVSMARLKMYGADIKGQTANSFLRIINQSDKVDTWTRILRKSERAMPQAQPLERALPDQVAPDGSEGLGDEMRNILEGEAS